MEKKVVLIVEDNPKNRKIMVDLMEVHGYVPIEAENGHLGLQMAQNNAPDLILMDVQLPGMDGYETTKRLKANEQTKKIPVIIVTSFAMKGEERKAKEIGADDYVSKPIDIHQLMAKVKEHLEN